MPKSSGLPPRRSLSRHRRSVQEPAGQASQEAWLVQRRLYRKALTELHQMSGAEADEPELGFPRRS